MGSNRDSNGPPPDGDNWPPDRAFHLPDLPELPEGVRIPDDPAELAELAEEVRAELHSRPGPPARWAFEPAVPRSPRLPALIMCLAVVITLVSLFVMAWSPPPPPPSPPADEPVSLPAAVFTDGAGQPTDVAALAPTVIIFVERCRCDNLIAQTVAEAPAGVTVAVVGPTAPAPPSGQPAAEVDAVRLADPEGALRQTLDLGAPPADAATVVLADGTGVVQQVSPAASSVEPYRDALARLG
jgi:hypothetical protein